MCFRKQLVLESPLSLNFLVLFVSSVIISAISELCAVFTLYFSCIHVVDSFDRVNLKSLFGKEDDPPLSLFPNHLLEA